MEPNPELAAASSAIAPVHVDIIERLPWTDFDVVASFHVIEHVNSPRSFIRAAAERMRPGGLFGSESMLGVSMTNRPPGRILSAAARIKLRGEFTCSMT